jgi:hypothetical protein
VDVLGHAGNAASAGVFDGAVLDAGLSYFLPAVAIIHPAILGRKRSALAVHSTTQNFLRGVLPPPKLQDVFVVELALVHGAVSNTVGEDGFPHGVSHFSQTEQSLSVRVFIFGVGQRHLQQRCVQIATN